jgi:hypothetical protein
MLNVATDEIVETHNESHGFDCRQGIAEHFRPLLVDRAQQHIYRAFLFTYLCCDLFALMRGIIPTSYVSFEKGKGFVDLFGHGSPPKKTKVGRFDYF